MLTQVSPVASLTASQVKLIRRGYALYKKSNGKKGFSQSKLAASFSVSQATISNILNGKFYKKVK